MNKNSMIVISKTFNGAKKCKIDMTDGHKMVNRRRSVNSIYLLYSICTTCIHVVQRSAVLADTDIRIIVKRQPASVRKGSSIFKGWTTQSSSRSIRRRRSVIIAIRKVVPGKSGARSVDCAGKKCVIVWSIIFILFQIIIKSITDE